MLFRKKIILIFIASALLSPCAVIVWHESFYIDIRPFLSPITYPGNVPIRNDWRGEGDFGVKRNGNRRHQGIDILAPIGTPVLAVKGGSAYAGNVKKGMGKFVKIKHKNGMVTIYGHLAAVYIKPVQMVRQGQIIGAVGNTGNAKYNGIEPHLHFEVRKNGNAVDPKIYLPK